MKKSSIMIITAVLVTLGSLTAFNIDVKKVYLSGAYKSRFRDMEFTSLKGIENLDLQNADQMGIEVQYGTKEGIWIHKSVKEQITTNIVGQTLKIGIDKNSKEDGGIGWGRVIIITRKLGKVNTTSNLHITQENSYYDAQVSISGYQEGNLDLQISDGVSVSLSSCKLNQLTANIGDEKYGKADVHMGSDMKINTATFNIPGMSSLTLAAPDITKVTYNLSDSATVTLNGKLVQMIK